jgi:ABC-2 type transport system ATP-binding protein
MNHPCAIRIENLIKRFGKQVAVDRVSFEAPVGSVFGLLGENGAGKSTTIQLMLGLIRADSGRIETLGLDPARHGLEVRRRVGYVAEQPSLYDWMTVAQIGWFASGFHADPDQGTLPYLNRYHELIKAFQLPPNKKLKRLSKGMRAKAALSIAMAAEPELLVLDEPTSGLDLMVRREFLESMVDLAGAGRTVFLSSHQIAEVERVASHVALLHQGKLLLVEPLDDLKARSFILAFTFSNRDHADAPPAGSGVTLVDCDDQPRQARWLVHAADRATLEPLRNLPGVLEMAVETPSLEEIYVGYLRGRRAPGGDPPSLASAVA